MIVDNHLLRRYEKGLMDGPKAKMHHQPDSTMKGGEKRDNLLNH